MKTNELTGAILNWAVAKCMRPDDIGNTVPFHLDGTDYEPSRKWAHGGPIIERELLQVTPWPNESDEGMRWHCVQHGAAVQCHAYGPTPLIAAMRCFVASKMGDEVEIPEALK